jgi:Lsr2
MAARLRVLPRFRLDGTEYEIDLNAGHTQALRDALPPCGCGAAGRGRCVAASPVRSQGTGGRGGRHRSPRVGQRAGHRREDRGRVLAELVARFKAATPEVNQRDGPVAGL